MSHRAFYLVTGGRALRECSAMRDGWEKARRRLCRRLKSLGAGQYRLGFDDAITGAIFEGKPPDGWTKPDRQGCSRPKRGSEHDGLFDELRLPSLKDQVRELTGAPTDIRFRIGRRKEEESCGNPFFEHGLVWSGDDLCMEIPDVAAALAEIRAEHPRAKSIVFADDVDTWRLRLSGVKKILPEEWDLLVAKKRAKRKAAR